MSGGMPWGKHRALRTFAAGALGLALGAGAATQACSQLPPPQRPGTPPPGVQTPLPVPSTRLGSPVDPATDAARSLSIEDFAPLLSLPELEGAAAAYASEDYRLSYERTARALQARPLSPLEEPRWYLLLGRLAEKAEMPGEAELAYARSAGAAWPLADYAALGWGRMLLLRGEIDGAERVLAGVVKTGAPYADAQLLLADSSCQRNRLAECASHVDDLVRFAPRPRNWVSESVRLLSALLAGLPTLSSVPIAAGAAGVEPSTPSAALTPEQTQLVVRALTLLRKIMIEAPRDARSAQAQALEGRMLALLPSATRAEHATLHVTDQLRQLRALVDSGMLEEADAVAQELIARLGAEEYGEVGCEARLLLGKARGSARKWAEGVDLLEQVAAHCKGTDLRARALYTAGKYAFSDKRYTLADRLFARVETEAPHHSLADDSRLYRAEAQNELGVESRFTELLKRMPEDYPRGDMVVEGIFRLALRRIEKGDWAGAAVVLRRGVELSQKGELSRGQDEAGRERYFLARALIQTGEEERGLAEFEAIIEERPLSYYMLSAYSRLVRRDPQRAERALARALEGHAEATFSFGDREELESPGFIRVTELMRQSDFDDASRELRLLDASGKKPTPELWWGIAMLYARAGSVQLSHAVARWRVKNWLERWPVGPWRQAWEIAFPRPHLATVVKEADQNALEPALVYAIMREESAFDASAVSVANAYGLMQVIMPTARYYGKLAGVPISLQSLKTPNVNIAVGSRVLSSYMAKFPDNPVLGIPGYNAGPGRPKRWIKDFPSVDFDVWVDLIPLRETRRYTKRVLASRSAYRFLYYADEGAGDPLLLPERLQPSGG
jgi:soluble lytic murein transglycosylase